MIYDKETQFRRDAASLLNPNDRWLNVGDEILKARSEHVPFMVESISEGPRTDKDATEMLAEKTRKIMAKED